MVMIPPKALIIMACILAIWLLAINIGKYVLEYIENQPSVKKDQMIVKIREYLPDSHPPCIVADRLNPITGNTVEVYLKDYDRKFEFECQVYHNKWVIVELSCHYTGFIILHVHHKVYSMKATYI